MTKSRFLAALAATLLATGLIVSDAQSQGIAPQTAARPAAAAATGPVALLDVSRVFKNHARFKSMMDNMKAYVQEVEGWVKSERNTIRGMAEKLQELQSGTQDYNELEAQIAKRNSDLQVNMQLKRKELMQQEAKIYHTVYTEIEQEVAAVAASHGFVIVLRYNGDEVDRQEPEDVLRDINKSVIWFNHGVDITDEVLTRIASRSQYKNTTTGSTQNRQGIPAMPARR